MKKLEYIVITAALILSACRPAPITVPDDGVEECLEYCDRAHPLVFGPKDNAACRAGCSR